MNLVHELPAIADRQGRVYFASVVGEPAADGLWNGAITFRGKDGVELTTYIETRQPDLAGLVYWSTGLTPAYVEGALERARAARDTAFLEAADVGWAMEEIRPRAPGRPLPRAGARPPRQPRPASRTSRPASRSRTEASRARSR